MRISVTLSGSSGKDLNLPKLGAGNIATRDTPAFSAWDRSVHVRPRGEAAAQPCHLTTPESSSAMSHLLVAGLAERYLVPGPGRPLLGGTFVNVTARRENANWPARTR